MFKNKSKKRKILTIVLIVPIAMLLGGLMRVDNPSVYHVETESLTLTSPTELRDTGYEVYVYGSPINTEEDAAEAAHKALKGEISIWTKIMSNNYHVYYDEALEMFQVFRYGFFGDPDYYVYIFLGEDTVYYNESE
ncbi:MAG: hypothetical protein QM489_02950 [Candidatus Izemoplasma sp.]